MSQFTSLNPTKLLRTAEVLKSIAHPIRLQVLEVLSIKDNLCVSDLQEEMKEQIEQSLLSHHLIRMKNKGILKSKKQGLNVMYSLVDKNIASIFDCMKSCKLMYD